MTAVTRPRTTTVRPQLPGTTPPPSPSNKSQRRAPPVTRGILRKVFRATLVIALILTVIIGGIAFRLSQGPIPLNFAKTTVEGSASAALQDRVVRLGDLAVTWTGDGPELQLRNVAISERNNGPVLLQIPAARIALSTRGLLTGHVSPSSIELDNARIQVFYADDGRLSLQFQKSGDTQGAPLQSTAPSPTDGPIDVVKAITSISAQARAREHSTSYLRRVVLKDTSLLIDNGLRKSLWRVPELKIDLNHKRSRSLISGQATVASLTGPWSLEFSSEEMEDNRQLVVDATVRDLSPRGVARQLPALAAFEHLDVPLDGKAKISVSATGKVDAATFELAARSGRFYAAGLGQPSLEVAEGELLGTYDGTAQRIEIKKAALAFEDNRIEMAGALDVIATSPTSARVWRFDFKSNASHLASPTPNGQPIPIETLSVRGQTQPDLGRVLVQQLLFRAGGGEVTARARVDDIARMDSSTSGIEGNIGPMPAARLLAVWPRAILPDVRTWLAANLTKGQLTGGHFRIVNAAPTTASQSSAAPAPEAEISLTLETQGLEIAAREAWPRIEIPRALIRVEGGSLEVTAPDVLTGPEARRLAVKTARFTAVPGVDGRAPTGELAFRLQGSALTLAEILDREPNRVFKNAGLNTANIDGKLDGQLKITLPLAHNVATTEIRTEGRVRLTDGRIKQAVGKDDISGGKFDIDISDKAIDGHGEMLLAGVPLRITGQHFLNTTHDKQPPLRITAVLDNADRTQLGLDINDLVQGEVPIEILAQRDAKGDFKPRVRADLTKAELTLDSVAWRKPPARQASFQFEPVRGASGRLELQNVKLVADNIAAEGSIIIGPDNKAKEFSFPEFSLNVVSRLEIYGKMRPDNIWDVRAKGATFDGRDLFRELFTVGDKTNRLVPKNKAGLDMNAEIDTVLGFNESNLKNVRVVLQRRNDNGNEKMMSLDVIAQHTNGKQFQAQIRNEPRVGRRLAANSDDAGLTFKAVGFYPNAVGGRLGLEVLLDGRASIERSGNLVTTNFAVLGDPIVSEVFQSTDGTQPAPGKKKVVRQQIDFDWMRVPFSIGSGQLVMNDGQIKGPLLGATMRGKIDFKSQMLQINGTYAPLSGLNSALAGIPGLGALIAGPKGEGIFGITFQVAGPTANPEVIVNPFSMMAPGVFREIFQMGPEQFNVNPRIEPLAPQRGDAARASSAPPATKGAVPPAPIPRTGPQTLSDWTAEQKPAPRVRQAPAQPPTFPPQSGQ